MTFLEAMHTYYSGQRYVALAGALAAILCLLVAWAAYARKTYPARSFGITVFLLAGLFMLPANVAYFFYAGPQAAQLESTLARSQAAFNTAESTHLNKMMDGFRFSYRFDSTLALLGLLAAAAGSAKKSNKAIGIGLAITLCTTTLLSGEVWSKHRALHYRESLIAAHLADETHPF